MNPFRILKQTLMVTSGWVIFFQASLQACTAVSLGEPGNLLLGKSYDWDLSHGYVLVNKRNVQKTALAISPLEKPATWKSLYGSTTFNQYGQEFPLSGYNEKGLVVEILWLDETKYPEADQRKSVNELQWVQYQLDNYANVAEVVANVESIRIAAVSADVHYMVCDVTAACATVEFLDGRAVVHTNEMLPHRMITNNTYEKSLSTLQKHVGFGGTKEIPQGTKSLERFVRAAALAKQESPTVSGIFGILASVKQGAYSVWNLVYELSNGRISFRTHDRPQIKYFDSHGFDYSCKRPVVALNIQTTLQGDVTNSFRNFESQENLEMIKKSLDDGSFLHKMLIEYMASYPGKTKCQE